MTARWWQCLVLGCLFAFASGTGRVVAQAGSPGAADYEGTIGEALEEFNAGNYQEARALFVRAHELKPSARTFRGIGMSAYCMRDYLDAISALEAALASPERALDGSLRTSAQDMLERSFGFVGRYQIGLAPENAVLRVDDVESSLKHGDRLLLPVGHHTLEASAPAYQSAKRGVDVRGGEAMALSFTLVRAPVTAVATPEQAAKTLAQPSATPLSSERSPGTPLYKRPWLWTVVGVAVAGVVVAVAVATAHHHGSHDGPPVQTSHTLGVQNGLWSVP